MMLSNLVFAQNKEVVFEIQNSFVQDSLMVAVKITNNTDKDIWLPIDTSTLAYDFSKINLYQQQIFPIRQIVYEKNIQESVPTIIEYYGDDKIDELSEIWENKVRSKTINDFVLLKSKESKRLNVCFYFNHYITGSFFFSYKGYENFENGQYDFYLSYQMNPESIEKYLSKEILDELKAKGYEPYFGKIESNRVPLVID